MRARNSAFRVATSAAQTHARAVFRKWMIGMALAAIAMIAAGAFHEEPARAATAAGGDVHARRSTARVW